MPAPPLPPLPKSDERTLKYGDSGRTVKAFQLRLSALGYWLGHSDGHFGGTTQQAVFALQKAADLSRSGIVTQATWKALDAGVRPNAKSKSGRLIEVNLERDLVLFVTDGKVVNILNTSTGGGYKFTSQGRHEVAITPKGHFKTNRVINGPHQAPLGLLYRPRYFNGGIAIHGDSSVPAQPVSHGCVRVSDAAMDWIWSTKIDPIGTTVWVY